MAFTTKLSNISSMGINPIPRSSPLPSPKGGSDQTAALAQWSVTFGKIKLFRIFGKLNANVVVCLIDELFNILLSYYCHGIHTPPRCDIGEFFFPDNPLFQPDRHDLRPNGHKLFFPKVSKFLACKKIKTYLWKSTIIENIPIECCAIQFYFR
jgi:hypothetical protein